MFSWSTFINSYTVTDWWSQCHETSLYSPKKQFTLCTAQAIANEIQVLCTNTIGILHEAFQLVQCKATEILAFIVSDINRQFSMNLPLHIPLAYALTGSSPKIETLREMLTRVRIQCQHNHTKILWECFDGQRAMMIFKSIKGEPPTRIQLNKKFCNDAKKAKKEQNSSNTWGQKYYYKLQSWKKSSTNYTMMIQWVYFQKYYAYFSNYIQEMSGWMLCQVIWSLTISLLLK